MSDSSTSVLFIIMQQAGASAPGALSVEKINDLVFNRRFDALAALESSGRESGQDLSPSAWGLQEFLSTFTDASLVDSYRDRLVSERSLHLRAMLTTVDGPTVTPVPVEQ